MSKSSSVTKTERPIKTSSSGVSDIYRIDLALTTIGSVYVRANSPEQARRAVQKDLDEGGWVLENKIASIEEEIPHSTAKAQISEDSILLMHSADYFVDSAGHLLQGDPLESSNLSEIDFPASSPLNLK